MVEQSDGLFTLHTGLNTLVANIECMLLEPKFVHKCKENVEKLYLQGSDLSEPSFGKFSLRCVLQAKRLLNFFGIRSKLLSAETRLELIFGDSPLAERNVIIKVSFHAVFSHLSFLFANKVVWTNIS